MRRRRIRIGSKKRSQHRKKKPKLLRLFTFKKTLLFTIVLFVLLFQLTRLYFKPPVLTYAKHKSTFYATLIINNAIRDEVVKNIDMEKIVVVDNKTGGDVSSIIINTYEVNNILAKMTDEIQRQLIIIENDPSNELHSIDIPLGVILNHGSIDNVGPKINVKLHTIGSVHTDIVSSVKPYGINNTLIEIILKTEVRFQVMIPFQQDEILVTTRTPLLIKVIQGEVPRYYYTGGGNYRNPPHDSGDSGGEDIPDGGGSDAPSPQTPSE
ncbi:sporulation protein YunB [Haloplasma contractile]|uniref:Sporulation protein YunB n=1 Tax=Haloplasma contractile SSD-17B TaxID=1033810 RepID=U2EFB2_9MOLU|nr:sporulation protein YunB [Haloplasma contractile]ERJ13366.1 sporulation protein YunB [Haloplasma contractile SSD-17B]